MDFIQKTTALVILLGWFWASMKSKKKLQKKKVITPTNFIADSGGGDMIFSSSSCDGICKLQEDTMVDILCRLPPETLMKYKSVSRAWPRLITEVFSYQLIGKEAYPPSGLIFCKVGFLDYRPVHGLCYCHCHPLSPPFNGLMVENYQKQTIARSFIKPLPLFSHHSDNRELLDCCNGLLLFRDSNPETTPRYIVCNPTTSECVVIPGKTRDTHSAFGALAFSPSESIHHKVVLVHSLCQQLKVFSSEMGRWTKFKFQLRKEILRASWYQPIYLDGMLFTMSPNTGHMLRIFINRKVSKIHRVQSIDLPLAHFGLELSKSSKSGCIGLNNGHLYYAKHTVPNQSFINGPELRIFTLEHDNDGGYSSLSKNELSWSLKHIIQGLGIAPLMFSVGWILAFYPHPDVIILGYESLRREDVPVEVWGNGATTTTVICYNYKLKKVQGRVQLGFKLNGPDDLLVFPFTRCFLPIAR